MKEENDATFYPSWYKPNSWRRVSPVPAEILPTVHDTDQMMCSPQPAGDPLPEAETQIQPQSLWSLASQPPPGTQQLPLSTELHAQMSENQPRPSSLLHEPHKVPAEPGSPQVRLTRQETAGEAGIMEEENEDEEDMQGWVCVPGTVDKGFSLAEGSFDLGEDGLNSISDKYDSPSSLPPEETRSGLEKDNSEMDKANFELRHGRADDSEDRKQHDDILDFEAEMMNERLRKEKVVVSMSENSSEPKNGTLDEEDHGVGSTDSFIQTGGGPEFEAGSKEEDGENREQHEDFNSAAETEEKITSSDSLQVSVVWFYLHHHHHSGYCAPHPPVDVAPPPHCLLLLSSFGLFLFRVTLQLEYSLLSFLLPAPHYSLFVAASSLHLCPFASSLQPLFLISSHRLYLSLPSSTSLSCPSLHLPPGCHSALLPVGLPGHPAEGLGLHRLLHLHITPTGDTHHPHCCTAQVYTHLLAPQAVLLF